jgi:iron complex transport system substrate-binding protein
VALKPDLVVATTAGNRHETFDQLAQLKIPVYLVNPVAVHDVLDLIARLGRLTDRPAAADRVAAELRERIQAVSARVAGRPRPRVLYVLWPDPLIVPARGALVSELIALAGGDSVTADGGQGYPRYSMEAALARNPEVILIASHDATGSPLVRAKWERFTQVPAVSAGRLHTVDGNLMHRYGPRIVDGLEALARLIHPAAR